MKTWSELEQVLPAATRHAWETLKRVLPPSAYLVGGTAIAVHLGHRESRDLDFFVSDDTDLRPLNATLSSRMAWRAEQSAEDTLNGYLARVKVQLLRASDQHPLETPTVLNGVPVAGLGDLMATKLRAVTARGELRDYFDIMELERSADLYVEEGIGLYLRRYRPSNEEAAAETIVRALGSFSDVADDPGLPLSRAEIEGYWTRRQPGLQRALSRFGSTPGPLDEDDPIFRLIEPPTPATTAGVGDRRKTGRSARPGETALIRCPYRTRSGRRCLVRLRPGSTCPAHRWTAPL